MQTTYELETQHSAASLSDRLLTSRVGNWSTVVVMEGALTLGYSMGFFYQRPGEFAAAVTGVTLGGLLMEGCEIMEHRQKTRVPHRMKCTDQILDFLLGWALPSNTKESEP
ncbi:hypothetical protein J4410_03970 [Candidatus Woesearchaeota archaeon]|nr:hypothetical protein [Candidatus Woesearchaeota archaeon]